MSMTSSERSTTSCSTRNLSFHPRGTSRCWLWSFEVSMLLVKLPQFLVISTLRWPERLRRRAWEPALEEAKYKTASCKYLTQARETSTPSSGLVEEYRAKSLSSTRTEFSLSKSWIRYRWSCLIRLRSICWCWVHTFHQASFLWCCKGLRRLE